MKKLLMTRMLMTRPDRPLIENGAVLLDGEIIEAVGPTEDFNASDHEVVDLKDQILMPGLIDSHNHLSLDHSLAEYLIKMNDSLSKLCIRACKNTVAAIQAGITTMRCAGDKEYLDFDIRQAISEKYIAGPNLILAGKGMRSGLGHGFVGYAFDRLEDLETTINANVSRGADFIKYYATGTARKDQELVCFYTKDQIEFIVNKAHEKGKPAAVHCVGGAGFDYSLSAGVDVIEHAYFVSDEQIEKLVSSPAKLVLTPSFYFDRDRIENMPDAVVQQHLDDAPEVANSMKKLITSGERFGIGTDGVHGPDALRAELEYISDCGASIKDTLLAATLWGAEICNLGDVTGSIEKGKRADFIGMEKNPLDSLEALKDIKTVISKGCFYDPLRLGFDF